MTDDTTNLRHPNAVSRLREVVRLTGLSRSTVYSRMDARSAHFDATFPRSFPLFGANQKCGAKGWRTLDVLAWLDAQAAKALPH